MRGSGVLHGLRRWLDHPRLLLWRQRLARLLDVFPWTPLGLLLTAGAGVGLRYFAYAEMDVVWLVMGYALLSLVLLAPLLVILTALFLRLGPLSQSAGGGAQMAERLILETGRARATGFSLPTLSYLPLVQLQLDWASPAAAVTLQRTGPRVAEHVTIEGRGMHSSVQRRIAISDTFGLCRIWVRRTEERAVTVLPALLGLSRIESFMSFAAGDDMPNPHGLSEGDRLELRRYAAGDPVRFIHWKLLARTGNLFLRTPERALSEADRVAAFLVAGERDEASAAVARLALTRGFLGDDFLFGTADAPRGVSGTEPALALVARSSGARARGAQGLTTFMDAAARGGPVSFVLFVPAAEGPWVEGALRACRAHRVHVIVGVDGLRQVSAPSWLERLWLAPRPQTHDDAAAVARIGQRFRAIGCSVAVYDRPAGRLLGPVGTTQTERAGRAA